LSRSALNSTVATVTSAAPSATSPSVRMPIGLSRRSRLSPIAMPAITATNSRSAVS
jgi:hypothetical protein